MDRDYSTEQDSKDQIYFVTAEEADLSKSTTESQKEEAYNPETGEINWDCPCIAGMTNPPCGETFKAAFSCFVYSSTEPKGADCIEQFRAMQECFQQHPDIYGNELPDDDDDEVEKHAEPVDEAADKL